MKNRLEKVCNTRSSLGEGPCWDPEKQVLYWIDIIEKKIHIYDDETGHTKKLDLTKHVGAIGLTKSKGLIAALSDGFYFINPSTGFEEAIAIVDDNQNNIRFNDGKIDPAGNFWAGTVSLSEKLPIGSMYCLDCGLHITKYFNNITISNGIIWSLDQKNMYFIDTPTLRVDVFDFDLETSDLRNRRIAINIPKEIGYPDGMTIDQEGMLWIAHWGGHKVCRWNPQKSEIIQTIDIPASRVSSCTFGGKAMDELFITTAKKGFIENISSFDEKESGYVFRIKVNVQGQKAFKFNK